MPILAIAKKIILNNITSFILIDLLLAFCLLFIYQSVPNFQGSTQYVEFR